MIDDTLDRLLEVDALRMRIAALEARNRALREALTSCLLEHREMSKTLSAAQTLATLERERRMAGR